MRIKLVYLKVNKYLPIITEFEGTMAEYEKLEKKLNLTKKDE